MAAKPFAPDRKGEYFWVDSRRLVEIEGFNRREDYGDIPALAAGIKAMGIDNLSPLTCSKKGDYYEVLKGHRRTRAIRLLEAEGQVIMVPVILRRRGYSIEMAILDQATENEGKHFTPWEKAKIVRDLRGMGWSLEDMIERTKWSEVYIRRLLSLADAPQKLINLVRSGVVKGTFAMDMIAEERVAELIEKGEKGEVLQEIQEPELFPSPEQEPPKNRRITKSDLQPHNSWKICRKWVAKADEKELPPEKIEMLNFMRQLIAGQLSEEDIINYFR